MRSINMARFNFGRIYGVAAAFACLAAANAAVVEPVATDEILCNPGMGFFHFCYSGRLWAYGGELKPGDTLEWMPGTTVTYMRLPWSYLEPEEGVYRWDLFEAKARPWLAAGKKLGFRISCMNISIASTPQWVLDAGAKGVWRDYSNTGTKSMVWEPVWDDPVYLAKYENFLKAFAERYDGNPDVAFVDLGSFGKFGEGHSDILNKMRSSSDPAQRLEYERICKLHIDILRRCLPNTYLVVSDDIGGGGWMKDPKTGKPIADHPIFEYCRSLGIGLRDDSIMCAPPPNHWASAHFGRKFAETTPVIIETGQITRRLEKGIWDPEKLLLCIEDYHASYLGVHGFPDLCWEKNKHVWQKTANRMGYRFELRRVEYPDAVKVSEPVVIRSTWVNTGVAPQYANSSLTWSLLNDDGVVCWSVTDTRVGMRSLAPKWDGVEKPQTLESHCTFGYTAPVPDGGKDVILNWCRKHHRNDPGEIIELLKPGTYTLAVSVGRKDGKPEIALPLAGGVNRVYPIGKIVVR